MYTRRWSNVYSAYDEQKSFLNTHEVDLICTLRLMGKKRNHKFYLISTNLCKYKYSTRNINNLIARYYSQHNVLPEVVNILVQILLRLMIMLTGTGIPPHTEAFMLCVESYSVVMIYNLMCIQMDMFCTASRDVAYVNAICCFFVFHAIFMVIFVMSSCSRHSIEKI